MLLEFFECPRNACYYWNLPLGNWQSQCILVITVSYGYSPLKYQCNELLKQSIFLVLGDKNLSQMSLYKKWGLVGLHNLGWSRVELVPGIQTISFQCSLFPSLGFTSLRVGFIFKWASHTQLQRQPLAALGLQCPWCLQSQKRPFHNLYLYQSLKKSWAWLYLLNVFTPEPTRHLD